MKTYTAKDFMEDMEIIIEEYKEGVYSEELAMQNIKMWMNQIGKEMVQ